MDYIKRNVLTILMTLSFFVVSVTGIMLYFKLKLLSVELIHIWIGFGMFIIGVLHLLKNWKPFVSYLKKSSSIISFLIGILIISSFIIIPIFEKKDDKNLNPKVLVFNILNNSSLSKIAVFINVDEKLMIETLSIKTKIEIKNKYTIEEISKNSNLSKDDILKTIFSLKQTKII